LTGQRPLSTITAFATGEIKMFNIKSTIGFRDQISLYVNQAVFQKIHSMIVRRGKVLTAVIPYAEYHELITLAENNKPGSYKKHLKACEKLEKQYKQF
jgi:hypothetical protein